MVPTDLHPCKLIQGQIYNPANLCLYFCQDTYARIVGEKIQCFTDTVFAWMNMEVCVSKIRKPTSTPPKHAAPTGKWFLLVQQKPRKKRTQPEIWGPYLGSAGNRGMDKRLLSTCIEKGAKAYVSKPLRVGDPWWLRREGGWRLGKVFREEVSVGYFLYKIAIRSYSVFWQGPRYANICFEYWCLLYIYTSTCTFINLDIYCPILYRYHVYILANSQFAF